MTGVDGSDQETCAAWVARFLEARGVDRIFGLQGGHIQPIWDHVARLGIRIVDVRDEGAAVHMAHAHAELKGGLGVAMVTAGPGVTNTVTAIANATLARAPVLLIGGCPPRAQVNMGPLQDIAHVDILRPVTRTARTLRVAEQVVRELDEAVARAQGDLGEPGPVYVEIPTDVLRQEVPRGAGAGRVAPGAAGARAGAASRGGGGGGRGAVVGAAAAGDHRARRARGRRRAGPPARRLRRALPRHPGEPRPGAARSPGGGRRGARRGDERGRSRAADRAQARLPAGLRLARGVPARALRAHRRHGGRADRQPARPAGGPGDTASGARRHGRGRRQPAAHARSRLGRRPAPAPSRAHRAGARQAARQARPPTARSIPRGSSRRSPRWPRPTTSASPMAATS